MRVIRRAWSDETAHARGKQSGRSLVEAKADCVTERDTSERSRAKLYAHAH